jgi:hypothetical protein
VNEIYIDRQATTDSNMPNIHRGRGQGAATDRAVGVVPSLLRYHLFCSDPAAAVRQVEAANRVRMDY